MNKLFTYLLPAVTALLIAGCSHEDPEYLTYEEEILRFIIDSPDGRELYSNQLYSEESFYIDDTLLVYYDIESMSRLPITVDISDKPKDVYIYKSIYDAYSEIKDVYSGNLCAISGSDTTILSPMTSTITRFAYFLKLFDDSSPYKGWIFWGYGCRATAPKGLFNNTKGVSFSSEPTDTLVDVPGQVFYQEDKFPILNRGDSLAFTSDSLTRIFAESNIRKIQTFTTLLDGDKYKTGWRIPSNTNRFINLIMFDAKIEFDLDTVYTGPGEFYIDTSIQKENDFIIPYKINL